jgi:hypothetical protein
MDLKSSKSVWTSNQVNQYGPQIKQISMDLKSINYGGNTVKPV